MESDVLFLTVDDRRLIRSSLRRQGRIMRDAIKHLEDACEIGDHYGVLVAFGRATHKWTDAVGMLATVVELTGSGPKDWIEDAYDSIDNIYDEDQAVIVRHIADIAAPLMRRLPKIFVTLIGYKELLTLNHHIDAERKDVLMERVRHYRGTLKVSEHRYEDDELPKYSVSALIDSEGNTFFGGDEMPGSPVEALGACNARIHRLYERLLGHVESTAPHAMLLKVFNDRLNLNDRIINNLMFRGTNNVNAKRRTAG